MTHLSTLALLAQHARARADSDAVAALEHAITCERFREAVAGMPVALASDGRLAEGMREAVRAARRIGEQTHDD